MGVVITAFEPRDGLLDAVRGAVAQAQCVVVVDDGSRGDDAERVLARAAQEGAQVVRLGANRGIAAALNAGVARLRETPLCTHVLTLDQDSVLPDSYVDLLLAASAAAAADGIDVAMTGPGHVGSMHRPTADGSAVREYEIGTEPIQSGLLIPLDVLDELGGFDEGLFIDGVDSDFYLRARRARRACVIAPGAELAHRLGRGHQVSVAGRSVELTVASNFRYYYQGRNLVTLVRRYAGTAPAWSAGAILREARHLALVTAAVPGRQARLREVAAGLRDGVRGRSGRRPDPDRSARLEGVATDPRVSVCMAAYNGEQYIGEQLASILEQLGPTDEVVVVDDASRDATVAVVEGIADPRIRLVRQEANAGYVRTFERALRETRGDVLLLADQDDVWLPGRVAAMVADLREADIVATNLVTLDGPETIRGPFGQRDWHLRAADSRRPVRNVLGILAGNRPYYGCAMGVRREALDAGVLPFPAFLDESHDLWLALYGILSRSIVHDERRTLARRYHASNASPNRPRGVVPVLRSRWMLVRCVVEIVRRRQRGRKPERSIS